jgi:hypothetical protein
VSWVAVGMAGETLGEVGRGAKILARRYLKPGSRFRVEATGGQGVSPSDVGGVATSSVVDEVRGARVNENSPQVVLRAGLAESGGFVGVENARGPGGTPTGDREAVCLVSGGLHSSVLSWMALLSGYRVRMVHAQEDEESALAVARLYAELSHRVGPTAVALEILVGGDPATMLNWLARQEAGSVLIGSHSGCGEPPKSLSSFAEAPLYLAQEEWFLAETEGLIPKTDGRRTDWSGRSQAPLRILRFDGLGADVNQVLDGLRSRPRSGR